MEAKKQVEFIRRALAHIAARTTDRETAPTTVSVDRYLDEERYAREVDILFRKSPVMVGHVSQLVSPGDFITHDGTGVPILVVRGDDGKLNAFLNVCRHRGTRLVEDLSGKDRRIFVCPYHAWCYGRDGSLQAIPHDYGFVGVNRDDRGLVRVPVGEAAGFVFVRPTAARSRDELNLDAAAWLGEIADDLSRFGLGQHHVYHPRSLDRDLNWKLSIDIFLETYHLRPTHKNTIYPMFFDNMGIVDRVGPHMRNAIPKRTIRNLANEPDEALGSAVREHTNLFFHLFPNTIILMLADHVSVVSMWPLGIGRTRFSKFTLTPEPVDNDKARAYFDLNNSILHNATEEDIVIGESIQKGLATGANKEVVFGAFEHALAHFHAQIDQRLAAAAT